MNRGLDTGRWGLDTGFLYETSCERGFSAWEFKKDRISNIDEFAKRRIHLVLGVEC
jgi:hypothetical protein